jgi:hypothetical protein
MAKLDYYASPPKPPVSPSNRRAGLLGFVFVVAMAIGFDGLFVLWITTMRQFAGLSSLNLYIAAVLALGAVLCTYGVIRGALAFFNQ